MHHKEPQSTTSFLHLMVLFFKVLFTHYSYLCTEKLGNGFIYLFIIKYMVLYQENSFKIKVLIQDISKSKLANF